MSERRLNKVKKFSAFALCLLPLALCLLLGSCDPVAKHKVLTTFFDGVPRLPTVDKLCREHVDEVCSPHLEDLCGEYAMRIASGPAEDQAATYELKRSVHPPFAEKKCQDCHDFSSTLGFVAPKNKLCFVCHKNFITGKYVHGPVSVADCLACHLPHDSVNTSLLKEDRNVICGKCHQEKRLAASMHEKVIAHGMACVDCHDPHSGNAKYFLK